MGRRVLVTFSLRRDLRDIARASGAAAHLERVARPTCAGNVTVRVHSECDHLPQARVEVPRRACR